MLSVIQPVHNGQQPIKLGHFTDGTLKMRCRLPENPLDQAYGLPLTIQWKYEAEEELVALIHLVHHLRDHGFENLYLDMPYLPNARQDRVQCEDEVFTLKSFAKTINWLNFKRVYIRDAHSRVSVALLDRVVNRVPDAEIENAVFQAKWDFDSSKITVFYPDEGAMKRYSDTHEYPRAFGMKTRNPETNRVDSLKIAGDADHIKDHYVLIVDDICSKGDTALRSAKELLMAGAKGVALYITHCENTILQNTALLNTVDFIYTTDSIFTGKHDKIKVLTDKRF
jgi:ribose-phosphate pyrophosphokinase